MRAYRVLGRGSGVTFFVMADGEAMGFGGRFVMLQLRGERPWP